MPAGAERNEAEPTRYTRFDPATLSLRADVAELVDAHGSGPCGRKLVEVQVLSSASGIPRESGNGGEQTMTPPIPRPPQPDPSGSMSPDVQDGRPAVDVDAVECANSSGWRRSRRPRSGSPGSAGRARRPSLRTSS